MTGSRTWGHGPRPARRRPRHRPAAVLGLCGALLVACGGSDPAGDPSGAGAGQSVTFLNILPVESLSFAPELLAQTGGQFAAHGLTVKFETTQGSAPAIQTIIAGSALITRVGDIETVLAAGGKNAPIVNIGTVTKRAPIRIVSSKRAPITKAADFQGKLVGIPSEGGTSSITVDLVVASAGIEPASVRRQVVGLAPGVFNLVQAGRIDAYVVSLDTAVALAQQQPDAVVFDPADAISSGGQLYLTSKRQAEDPAKQDQLRRYLRAIQAAIRFIIKDQANGFAETMRLIGSRYDVPALKTPEVARESLNGYVESWTAEGADTLVQTSPDTWRATYQEMVAARLIDAGKAPADWFTDRFAPGTS
jgi:NitT/TauT family transport system substrate-binding protein